MTEVVLQGRDERIKAVAAHGGLNGIAWLEVVSTDQRTLAVEFVAPLPGQPGGIPAGPPLTADQVRIDGGVRVLAPPVLSVAAVGGRLTVTVAAAGDFSSYRLRLVASASSQAPPAGFDPALAGIDFSFKVGCPNPFDCKADGGPAEPAPPDAPIDYLARDYAGLRGLMLDRLAATTPGWTERNPVDQQVMLVELLAATADQLSYQQDAVATEAYLGTARHRASLQRHARLLDYRIHQGNNARTWLHVAVQPGSTLDGVAPLPAHTPVLTGPTPRRLDAAALAEAVQQGATVFETLHAQTLHATQNEIVLHTWSHALTCLPRGSTSAMLQAPQPLGLQRGDALLLEQTLDPVHGDAERDAARRWVVRLLSVDTGHADPIDGLPLVQVRWHAADALPFALPLEATVPLPGGGGTALRSTAVARGNLLLADHGQTRVEPGALQPPTVPVDGRHLPRLRRRDLSFAQPYDDAAARAAPASIACRQDPRAARPAVWLDDGSSLWQPRPDLLASDRLAPEFVVEMAHDRSARLRFGDGVQGRRPAAGTTFGVRLRTGNGTAGQVGADVLRQLATPLDEVLDVRNPLPATGATEPESAEAIRRHAPQAFRVQQRAVTEADYAAAAMRHPEVQRARCDFRWTGSWTTAVVTVDRRGGGPVNADPVFRDALAALLGGLRTMGGDVALRDPRYVPLRITLQLCLQPGYFAADVHRRLREVFGAGLQPDGRPAFFHPDAFSFGAVLWLSALQAAAMAVQGVRSVAVLRLQRWGRQPAGELQAGLLRVADSEILRCDSDANRPENGRIDFEFPA